MQKETHFSARWNREHHPSTEKTCLRRIAIGARLSWNLDQTRVNKTSSPKMVRHLAALTLLPPVFGQYPWPSERLLEQCGLVLYCRSGSSMLDAN